MQDPEEWMVGTMGTGEGGEGGKENYIIPSHPSSHANNDDKGHKDNVVYLTVSLDRESGGGRPEILRNDSLIPADISYNNSIYVRCMLYYIKSLVGN